MSQIESGGQSDGLREEASARMRDAADLAQEKAVEVKERGSSRLQSELDSRSRQLGDQLLSVAQSLRSSGAQLEGQGDDPATKLTAPAAHQIERVGSYLQRSSGGELMTDIESFARQRPWMLTAVGVLTGVAAARFVKASSDRRAAAGPGPIRLGYTGTTTVRTVEPVGHSPYGEPAHSPR
jgi:hypothetical protein